MTSKRSPGHRSELDRPSEPESPSTLRSIEVADVTLPDHESPLVPVYYEPQPLVAVSDHKTIEVETIKLADDIDPRKLPTELRLARPSAVPPDSGWPQTDIVVVSSQPPLAVRRRWRVPFVLLALLGALLLLVLARSATRSSQTGVHAVSAAVPLEPASPSVPVAPPSPTPTFVAPAPPSAPEVASAEAPSSAPAPSSPPSAEKIPEKRANPARSSVKFNPRSTDPTPSALGRALAAPSTSKPKRAIY